MPRLPNSDARRIVELSEEITTYRDGAGPILDSSGAAIRELADAQSMCAFDLEIQGECVQTRQFHSIGGTRTAEAQRRILDAFLRTQPIAGWSLWNPVRPEARQRNICVDRERVLRLTGSDWRAAPVASTIRRMGLEFGEQLRILVCEGPVLLSVVGFFRWEPFTERERTRLGKLIPALVRRRTLERALEDATLARPALAATLQAIAAPAFIIGPGGGVLHCNDAGREMLDRDPTGWRERLRRAAGAGGWPELQLTRIGAPGIPPHFLVVAQGDGAELSGRAALAAGRWELTRREGQVLRLLARGSSNKTIALELGCSVRTAEAHVTHILERSGCDSRSEVLSRLYALPG